MGNEYFVEDLGAIPFRLSVNTFKKFMPSVFAYPFAAYYRICDLIGWRSKPRYAFGTPESGTTVPPDELPARAMSRWAPILERLSDLGFRSVHFKIGDRIGARESAVALFLDGVGSTLATLEWFRIPGNGIAEQTPLEFNSYGADDPETMTGMVAEEHMGLADMFKLDFVDSVFVSNKVRLERVYQQHQERIRGRSHYVLPLDLAAEEHTKRARRRFNWLLERRIIRQLSPAEIERVKQHRLPY
jgi:hypothetical protein